MEGGGAKAEMAVRPPVGGAGSWRGGANVGRGYGEDGGGARWVELLGGRAGLEREPRVSRGARGAWCGRASLFVPQARTSLGPRFSEVRGNRIWLCFSKALTEGREDLFSCTSSRLPSSRTRRVTPKLKDSHTSPCNATRPPPGEVRSAARSPSLQLSCYPFLPTATESTASVDVCFAHSCERYR